MEKEPFPSLFHFPSFERFVIFDLETTGLDEKSQPFQFSAIKVENWRIVDYFDAYANVPLDNIPFSLVQKLHLDELKDKIKFAPDVGKVVDDFLSFIGDLPLVAHNVWFDIKFLRRYKEDLANPFLDSIELFFLAYPLAGSYSLEELSNQENIQDEISSLQSELGLEGLFPHNALYDCLALLCLLKRAIGKIKNSSFSSLLHYRNISLAESIGISPPPTDFFSLFKFPASTGVNSFPEGEKGEYSFNPAEVLKEYDRMVVEGKWEKRESQRVMVQKVAELFQERQIGMIEAPTGTGKTLAYLIPSVFYARLGGGKVIISTYTKHLQNQVVSDMENKLLPLLPYSPRYILLKGRGNYLCLRRLLMKIEDGFQRFPEETSDEEKFLLVYLGRFLEEIGEKIEDLDAFPFFLNRVFPFLSALKENIKSEREICIRNICPFFYSCFYWRAQKSAQDADIIITNHWLLLMKQWENPEQCCVVIDEAHSLEDAASKALGEEVGKENIADILSLFLNREGNRGLLLRVRRILGDIPEMREALAILRDLWRFLDEMGEALCSFLLSEHIPLHPLYGASLWMRRSPRRDNEKWTAVEELKKRLRGNISQLDTNVQRLKLMLSETTFFYLGDEIENLSGHLKERINSLLELLRWDYDKVNTTRWIEVMLEPEAPETIDLNNPPGEFILWAVKEAPIRVGKALQDKIYNSFGSVILTSATLTVAGSGFGFFLDRLGIDNVKEKNLLSLPPVFNYEENALLALPDYLVADASYKNIEEFQKEVLEELYQLIKYVEGRSLVLFAARDRLEWVAERLEPFLSDLLLPLYWQKRGVSTRHILKEFREREEATLMGLRSFWEGVDVPGPSLCYLVLEKLPFPSVSEPLIQARREEIRRRGGDEYWDYLLPLTIILFKQGFGRLIRSHNDKGVVLFLDKRLRYDIPTQEVALNSLPGFKRIEAAEKSRKELYRVIGEHMKDLFPNFPWEHKLLEVKEAIPPKLEEKKDEILEHFKAGGSFLVLTLDSSSLFSAFIHSGMKVALISPYDPSYSIVSDYEGLVYLSSQPALNMGTIFQKWEKGDISLLAIHPYWLEDDEVRKRISSAEILLFPNALSFHYSSNFFSPFLLKNRIDVKKKISVLPPVAQELIPDNDGYDKVIPLGDNEPNIIFGRITGLYLPLNCAKEKEEDVIIYTPIKGQEIEEILNREGFIARWGDSAIPLFQKDLLHFLILPPGQKVDKPGTRFVIHLHPFGDMLSYLVEAYQAGLSEEGGYALSFLQEEIPLEELYAYMFPEQRDIEVFWKRIKDRREFLIDLEDAPLKDLRVLYLLWSAEKAHWWVVEKEIDVVLLSDVEDKELKHILYKAGVTDKRKTRVNLLRYAMEFGIPIEILSSSLRRSLFKGGVFYEIRKRGIVVKAKSPSAFLPTLSVSREEVLAKWRSLQEWITSLPLIKKVF